MGGIDCHDGHMSSSSSSHWHISIATIVTMVIFNIVQVLYGLEVWLELRQTSIWTAGVWSPVWTRDSRHSTGTAENNTAQHSGRTTVVPKAQNPNPNV